MGNIPAFKIALIFFLIIFLLTQGLAVAQFNHMEITNAGQAFRLGRYPIHFHLEGDVSQSYVKGCAIHRSFNRAVTMHGVHNLVVERNVIYNIRGNNRT